MKLSYQSIIYSFLVILLLSFSSCNSFVEDYEVSPNEPQNVSLPLLLPAAEMQLNITATGNMARVTSIFMQSQAGISQQYQLINQYQINESEMDNDWKTAYAGTLMDCKRMIDLAQKERKPYYTGIAKVIMAQTYGILTDCWGDIPLSEALQSESGINSPKFDRQQDVYQSIFRLLDEAIADLSLSPDQIPQVEGRLPGADDLYFGGNINNWLITAHILKARHHNRLSKIDPNGSASNALAEVQKAKALGASNATDMLSPVGKTESEANFWYQFEINRPGYMRMGKFIIDTMVKSKDPRLPYIASPAQGSTDYKGGEPGRSNAGVAGLSLYKAAVKPNQPIPMVTYAELLFIEAECHLRLNDPGQASEAYKQAINASLAQVTDNPTGVEAYKRSYQRTASTITLRDIMFQKYIALIGQLEVWFDYRRTDLPTLLPPTGINPNDFPRSFPTAASERIRNPNAPANFMATKRVWWENN
jgi:hypothetical protein